MTVRLDQAGLAEYAILPVHDEIVFDVPLGLADEVAREAAALKALRWIRREPEPQAVRTDG